MTRPIENLLPLPMDARVKPIMDFYHDALHELVCFGTHILSWALEEEGRKVEKGTEIDMAVPLLFRHILELVDAISVQIKVGIAVPCKIQLRALIEANLSLEYMLEKDRKRRAASFMIVDHYRKLNLLKKLAPGTTENLKLITELKEASLFFSNFSPIQAAGPAAKTQQELIELPIYKEVREAYLIELKKKPKGEIKWYSLFGGPGNVIRLATHLKKLDVYEFYYRDWSNPTHGTDLSTKVLVKGEDGHGAITQIRNMEDAYDVVSQTVIFMSIIYMELMAKKVVPQKRLPITEWFFRYKVEFRTPLEQRKVNFT